MPYDLFAPSLRVIERQRDFQLQETVIDLDSVRKANQPQVLGQEAVVEEHQKVPAPVQGTLRYQSEPEWFSYSFDPALTHRADA